MENRIIQARDYVSKTSSTLGDDNYWTVIVTITDRVKFSDQEDWVEESIEAMAIDNIFSLAVQTAMSSALSEVVDKVYNRGFAGLVESRQFDRENIEKVA